MKTLDPALVAHLGSRSALSPHVLVWFHAVSRIDGTPTPWGVWTGDDDRTFTIGAGSRAYFGAGSMAAPESLTFEAGYVVRMLRLGLSHHHPDVAEKLALTDLRLRRVELHQAHLLPGSHDLVAPPLQRFVGKVETLDAPRLGRGQSGMAQLSLASSARDMTRTLDVTKSDATHRLVDDADRFYRYIATSGRVSTSWGELSATGAPAPITPTPTPTPRPGGGGNPDSPRA